MLIMQDGNLYIQKDKGIIGVDINSDGIQEVKGSETKLTAYKTLTPYEVYAKFQINKDNDYVFPRPEKVVKKEVKKDESTSKTKKPTGKSK